MKLSSSKKLELDGGETGVLFSDSSLQLRRKNADVPYVYFILLDAERLTPFLVFNQNAIQTETGSWVLPRSERQTLQSLYTQGAASYGSVHNLSSTSNLSVSKVSHFLQ